MNCKLRYRNPDETKSFSKWFEIQTDKDSLKERILSMSNDIMQGIDIPLILIEGVDGLLVLPVSFIKKCIIEIENVDVPVSETIPEDMESIAKKMFVKPEPTEKKDGWEYRSWCGCAMCQEEKIRRAKERIKILNDPDMEFFNSINP